MHATAIHASASAIHGKKALFFQVTNVVSHIVLLTHSYPEALHTRILICTCLIMHDLLIYMEPNNLTHVKL